MRVAVFKRVTSEMGNAIMSQSFSETTVPRASSGGRIKGCSVEALDCDA